MGVKHLEQKYPYEWVCDECGYTFRSATDQVDQLLKRPHSEASIRQMYKTRTDIEPQLSKPEKFAKPQTKIEHDHEITDYTEYERVLCESCLRNWLGLWSVDKEKPNDEND